jgi:hypothetical protein
MARRRWMLWMAVLAVLGGCGPAGGGSAVTGPGGDDLSRLRQQAREALARYDKAVSDAGRSQSFVPVGELTGQVGNWEPTNPDNKQALLSGRFAAATHCPPRRNRPERWFGTTGRPRQCL